jgi:hypothetical protein
MDPIEALQNANPTVVLCCGSSLIFLLLVLLAGKQFLQVALAGCAIIPALLISYGIGFLVIGLLYGGEAAVVGGLMTVGFMTLFLRIVWHWFRHYQPWSA